MMKVALELQPCCGNRTGIGVYTYELAKRLRSNEEITYQGNIFNFCGRNDNTTSLNGITMSLAENHSMPYGVYRRLWNVLPFPYSSMFPDADITHFFNYIVPPKVSGKVITTIHDLTYLRFPETMDQRNLHRIRKGIARSIQVSEIILTVSEFSKREIVDLLHLPEEKVQVVYNAASLGTESADWVAMAKRYRITKPYLLYIGTIEPRKNLQRLLLAFERLKKEAGIPHQLVLAGGKGWKCEGIYQTAEKIYGSNDVIFCGYVSSAEKNALYQHAEIFVFPSLYEGFGIPPLEAMHFGVPVVCANAASLPEVVGEAACLVEPENELHIARGIYGLLSDEEQRIRTGEQGYARAKLFSWEHSAQKLEKIYRMLE